MIGLPPISRKTSQFSGRIRPPAQVPCSALAMLMPGWSKVAALNAIGDPIARRNSSISGAEAGCSTLGPPLNPAIERGPYLAISSETLSVISSTACALLIGLKLPSGWRLRQCVSRFGSLCIAGSARPLGQMKPSYNGAARLPSTLRMRPLSIVTSIGQYAEQALHVDVLTSITAVSPVAAANSPFAWTLKSILRREQHCQSLTAYGPIRGITGTLARIVDAIRSG